MSPSPATIATLETKKSPREEVEEAERPRPAKRARVAVACTRCKTRKQKCDGVHPTCGNCKNVSSTTCEYIVPSKSMPYGKYQYVKALEARVAELESLMANAGLQDLGKDHWEKIQQSEAFNDMNPSLPSPGEAPRIPPILVLAPAPNSSSRRQEASKSADETNYLRDLSLEAGGGYAVEGSSNITVGHIFRSIVRGKETTLTSASSLHSHLSPRPATHAESTSPIDEDPGPLPDEVAETLYKAYLKHISTRWPTLYPPDILSLHSRRLSLTTPFEISTLNLIYAIAARFLETTGVTGPFFPERHYVLSLQQLEKILQAHDIQSVQTLLLHAIYCLRAPRGLSAWTHVGLAIRICVELGMHRKTPAPGGSSLGEEMRKRIFWSCYCLDRQVSIILGRPFAVSDRDIDVELPLDVDDSTPSQLLSATPASSTSLSCFIHLTRLRRIESHIQQSVYRVDIASPALPQKVLLRFLSELSAWKDAIPPDFAESDTESHSYDGYEYYMIYYYKCLRLLLYPHILSPSATSTPSCTSSSVEIIQKCAEACGGVCRSYKLLHRQTSVGFSLMALYSVFLSGLTLLYCTWLSPKEIWGIRTSEDVNACSIVLYVITERWPGAKKYRDAFEIIRSGVLESIEGGEGGRKPLGEVVKGTLRDVGGLHPEGRREFERMVRDMIGDELLSPAATVQSPQLAKHQLPNMGGGSLAQLHSPFGQQQWQSMNGVPAQNPTIFGNGMQTTLPIPGVEGNIGLGDIGGVGADGDFTYGMSFLDDFNMDDFLAGGNPLGEVMF